MAKPPLCGDPGQCIRKSKRCSFECAISRRFQSRKARRDLTLKEDEVDENSLKGWEREKLTENNEKSVKYVNKT